MPNAELIDRVLGAWSGPSLINFGCEGRPCYIQGPHDDAAKVMRTLAKPVGK